jgi:hypothetical protein
MSKFSLHLVRQDSRQRANRRRVNRKVKTQRTICIQRTHPDIVAGLVTLLADIRGRRDVRFLAVRSLLLATSAGLSTPDEALGIERGTSLVG